MDAFAARIYQAIGMLQDTASRLSTDHELSRDDIGNLIDGLNAVISALEYQIELIDEACQVADDRCAAKEKC